MGIFKFFSERAVEKCSRWKWRWNSRPGSWEVNKTKVGRFFWDTLYIHGTSQDLIFNVYLLSPMWGSERPMGPVPCYDLRQLWDWYHGLLLVTHGTSHKLFSTFIYWVLCTVLRGLWDRSHVMIWDSYGTGPMSWSETAMGLIPWIAWWHPWEYIYASFKLLSIESHVLFWEAYGTSPMLWSQTAMGLIPWIASCNPWDFRWPFFNFYLLSPMYASERPMGPVPCIDLIYLWDWSHTLLCDIHGTSQDLIINIYLLSPMCGSEIPMGPVPCTDLRQLWDWSQN